MARPGVMIYFDVIPAIELLSSSDSGDLLKAILHYAKDGIDPVIPERLQIAWSFIKPLIDRDNERYEGMAQQNRYKAYKRECKRTDTELLDFDIWATSIDTRRYPRISSDYSRYPTTTTTTATATATTTTDAVSAAEQTAVSNSEKTEGGKTENEEHKYGEWL